MLTISSPKSSPTSCYEVLNCYGGLRTIRSVLVRDFLIFVGPDPDAGLKFFVHPDPIGFGPWIPYGGRSLVLPGNAIMSLSLFNYLTLTLV